VRGAVAALDQHPGGDQQHRRQAVQRSVQRW